MSTRLNPYISFDATAREAMQFYQQVFGGELAMNTFGEFGQQGTPHENLIMHAALETPSGYTLMGADTPPGMDRQPGWTVQLIVNGDDEAELRGYWNALADGATIDTPLEQQMWGDQYGQLTDKFGIIWMFNISSPQ